MRNLLLITVLITVLGVGLWSLRDPDHPSSPNQSEQSTASSTNVKARDEQLQVQGHPFELDIDRLFDRGYENDPELQAFAQAIDLQPACIIAIAKYNLHGTPIERDTIRSGV